MSTPGERLAKILAQLKASGIPQQEVARRIETPPQFLSDVKAGRSTLTATFAVRLERAFGINHGWLLQEEGEPWLTDLPQDAHPAMGPGTEMERLPLLDALVAGDPNRASEWYGARYPVFAGQARPAVAGGRRYVLRLSEENAFGELKADDLLLIENRPDISLKAVVGKVCTVQVGDSRTLDAVGWDPKAQRYRLAQSGREFETDQEAASQGVEILGICLSVIWRKISY
ncbi:MAG: helix-turn-helix domain-containing protein [Planctomycetes bacterium]|nr:helix-turn-helix domain-containing protein [Planctomycetota bacterium]